MKTLIGSFFIILINFCIILSQTEVRQMGDDIIDNTALLSGLTSSIPKNSHGIQVGGVTKTASGVLKVLVIFVRFNDDNAPWLDGTLAADLPTWAQNYVSGTIPSNGIYPNINISNLFNRASGGDGAGTLGAFQVIGDVYYVTTTHDESYFIRDLDVNTEVLNLLNVSPYNIDFRKYDNWQFRVGGKDYEHSYLPFNPATGTGGDGTIDQIYIIYRGRARDVSAQAGGYSTISVPTSAYDGKYFTSTSGSTLAHSNNMNGLPEDFYGAAHEYGHYLFGGGSGNTNTHFDGRTYDNHTLNKGLMGQFALMQRDNNGGFSMYERYRLGWLIPQYVTTTTNSKILQDSHVSNTAIMVPISFYAGGELKEYFLIDNYQTTNDYSGADPFNKTPIFDNNIVHGILIFHIENEHLTTPTLSTLDIECADGLWNWTLSSGASTPSDKTDDIIAKSTPTRSSGFDERNYVYITVGTYNNEYITLVATKPSEMSTWRYTKNSWLGDNDDFFNKDKCEILSPWSNPNSNNVSGTTSNIGLQILNYNSTTKEYTLKIAIGNSACLDLPPSKPQNLQVSASVDDEAVLTWSENIESDIVSGGSYKIYRAEIWGTTEPTTSDWDLVATIDAYDGSTPITSWTDLDSYIYTGPRWLHYKMSAVDNTNIESVCSDKVTINGRIPKQNSDSLYEAESNKIYSLTSYPNPFNPTTKIDYQIPADCYVTIKVYDSMGKEAATLINSRLPAGKYSTNFDGSNLSSGIYFCVLRAGDFVSTKKMMLIK